MRIAICEDNRNFRMHLHNLVADYGDDNTVIKSFGTGDQLWFAYQDIGFDLILLDIEMPGELSGLGVARKIRDLGDNVTIILITSYDKYSLEGYKVDAFRYLLKPVDPDELYCIFDAVKKRLYTDTHDLLVLEIKNGSYYRIPFNEIVYMESLNHQVLIHTIGREIKVPKRLNEVLQLCDKRFVLTHRSYVINLDRVRRLDNDPRYACALLDTGHEVPIAQTKKQQVFRHFIQYDNVAFYQYGAN